MERGFKENSSSGLVALLGMTPRDSFRFAGRSSASIGWLIIQRLGLVLFHNPGFIPAPVAFLQGCPLVVFLLAGSQCDFTFHFV